MNGQVNTVSGLLVRTCISSNRGVWAANEDYSQTAVERPLGSFFQRVLPHIVRPIGVVPGVPVCEERCALVFWEAVLQNLRPLSDFETRRASTVSGKQDV